MANLDSLAVIAAAFNASIQSKQVEADKELDIMRLHKTQNQILVNTYGTENIAMDEDEWYVKTADQGFDVKKTPTYQTNIALSQDSASLEYFETIGMPHLFTGDYETDSITINELESASLQGSRFEGGTVLAEDFYRDLGLQRTTRGKLTGFDINSPGYLGRGDIEQAENFIDGVLNISSDAVLDEKTENQLRDWDILYVNESWDANSAEDLKGKIKYRSEAFFKSIQEGDEYYTASKRSEKIKNDKLSALTFSAAITQNPYVQDLKANFEDAFGDVASNLINDTGDIGATGWNIIDDYEDIQTNPKMGVETAQFLRSIAEGISGVGNIEAFSADFKDGKVLENSHFHKVIKGLDELGLNHVSNSLISSVNDYMSYNQYVNANFEYIEGEIKDPKKVAWRTLMMSQLDQLFPDTELSYREMIVQGDEKEMKKALAVLFKSPDDGGKGWSEIPKDYRDAYLKLFFEERDLYIALQKVNPS